MNYIILKPGREASLHRNHHWIFSGAILEHSGTIKDGELIKILSHKKEILGFGHYSPSTISVRILQFGGAEFAENFWLIKISEALRLRKNLGLQGSEHTTAFRLVHGEGDGLPGLIVDLYEKNAVIQCHTVGMHTHIHEIAHALDSAFSFGLETIYDKSKESLGGAAIAENSFIKGNNAECIIKENGHLFQVNWVTGQKTGFFIDQRVNRKLLGEYSRGKSILNLFCYSGGFSIYALNSGASKVDSVDVSAKAMELTEANVVLNNKKDGIHTGFSSDVTSFLSSADEYDLIICDPPAFAKSMNKRHQALNGYKNLNAKVIKKVKNGGLLFTFSCSQVMDRELFQQTILAAALESNRKIKIIHHLSQSSDHPVNLYHPEGSYLKGLVLYIED